MNEVSVTALAAYSWGIHDGERREYKISRYTNEEQRQAYHDGYRRALREAAVAKRNVPINA